MAFISLLTRDIDVERAVRRALEDRHVVARAGGWDRLLHTVRERPVSCAILDEAYVPPAARPLSVLRMALDGVHRRPTSDEVAAWAGLSRPHLSVILKEWGLPSVGHLLVWGRLLHAGRWLTDPGRSAESISRQLEYSSGAAFRRALRSYVGGTPTEVAERGGFEFVMDRFMDLCGWRRWGRDDRSAA